MEDVKGYIWPAEADMGIERFKKAKTSVSYGFNRNRSQALKKGRVLVFYHSKHLLGSMPIERDAERATPELGKKENWVRDWKYVVWLDGSRKIEFEPAIHINDVAQDLRVLKGKTPNKFHRICRVAPSLSTAEYALLLVCGRPAYFSPSIVATLGAQEVPQWFEDMSPSTGPPSKVEEIRMVFKRNQRLIKRLKEHYDGRCQICGETNMFKIGGDRYYSEGHHKIPLGEDGYDDLRNVVIVCPLCHKKLHYAEDRETLKEKIRYSAEHERILRTFH